MNASLVEERRFTTAEPDVALRERLKRSLHEMGFHVAVTTDRIVAKRGSIVFVRFLGAFFAPSNRLPVIVDIQIAGDAGRELTARVYDNWGWGFRFGLEEVYKPLFEDIMVSLQRRALLLPLDEHKIQASTQSIVGRSWKRSLLLLGFAIMALAVAFALDEFFRE